MTEPVIRVEGLSKRYRIGVREQYGSLRESLMRAAKAPFLRLTQIGKPVSEQDTIWALKDVSFEVEKGEVVGIIGRNGAGKTTLLKILSRITEPTEGYGEIRGRVGSLLEVGTGFHPELTGRENIYLNGAILGMKKAEIDRKFDEIVAFAEVEKFLDTPVKHYSSGMYVRLAFAVAAHLEPEILLVDEVLAVGDAAFQKKCLGKMGDVAREGRTVLFVSHNMGAINRLCRLGIWLEQGQISRIGPAEEVVAAYMSMGSFAEGERRWYNCESAPGDEYLRLLGISIIDSAEQVSTNLDIRLPFCVKLEYAVLRPLASIRLCIRTVTFDGTIVFQSCDSADQRWQDKPRNSGVYQSFCEIPGNFLNEGQYSLTVTADIPFVKTLLIEENVLAFHIVQTGGVSGKFPERWPGAVCPVLNWKVRQVREI